MQAHPTGLTSGQLVPVHERPHASPSRTRGEVVVPPARSGWVRRELVGGQR